MNLQDVRTKTINWCSKMKDIGLLTPDQYDNCISTFKTASSGVIPKQFKVPPTGMPINYSLYNTRSESLSSTIVEGNGNTVMIITNTRLFSACDSNNNLYYITNINEPTINQDEFYFTLSPQSNNVYGIMSPYGKYLMVNNDYTVNFSGKTIGPMASWNINKINNNVTFESVGYPGFYLSFQNTKLPLKIVYGSNESVQWTMIPKIKTSDNSDYSQYTGAEYIVKVETVMTNIKNTAIDKLVLTIIKNTLITLQNNVSDNYTKLDAYMRSKLNYDAELYNVTTINYKAQMDSINASTGISKDALELLKSAIPRPSGISITRTQINGILYNILNTKNVALKLIDEEISKINEQIVNLPIVEPMDEYEAFMSDMNNQIASTTLKIQDNNQIMGRQIDNYDSLNKDVYYFNTRKDNYKKLDDSLKINFNIVDNYKTQNQYLVYIYPLILIICILFLIYLIYITYQKFMTNVYTQY